MTPWFMCMQWFPKCHSFDSLWLLVNLQGLWTPVAMITTAAISSSTYNRKLFSTSFSCAPQFPMDLLWAPKAGGKKVVPVHILSSTIFRDLFMHVEAENSLGPPERFVGHAWDARDMWSSQVGILAECHSVGREEKQEPVPRSYFKAAPLEPFDMDSAGDRISHIFIAHTST